MDYEKYLNDLVESYGNWWEKGFQIPSMKAELFPYTKLFEPITINKLKLKNRIVMAPMGNIDMCEETGRPNDKMLKYFEERAKGGVGLITTGLVPVTYGIDTTIVEKGGLTYFPRIDRSRTVFVGWRNLAAMCHSHNSALFIQLSAGLGRVGNPECLVKQYKFPRSASLNPNFYISAVPCLPLSDISIDKIIKRIGQGAADAKACNIDGVYLHGHEGYLIEQLSNKAFNRRKLGKYADYQAFGIKMIKEIRKRVGADYPIMYRIDLSLALNATYLDKMDSVGSLKKFKNERTIAQSLEYMANLVKAGVDMFDVDLGCYDNWWLPHPPSSMPAGCYIDIADITKKYFLENKIVSNKGLVVPIVAVGKLGYPDMAEGALRDGKCDMIMLGRPLLADPYWCQKVYNGEVKKIRPCIGCQEACLNEFVEGGHPQCAVNPRTAYENEYANEIPKSDISKKIAIVGAGVAGITAAEVLLARGHMVHMIESSGELGGSLIAASKGNIKYEIKSYLSYLKNIVFEMQSKENFKLTYHLNADAEYFRANKYDVIITACGATQKKPPIKGIHNKNVKMAVDVLCNQDLVKDAENIVVIGGGVVGAETAYFLSLECKKQVKVIEMDNYIMNHVCTANRGHIIHYLEQNNVELITGAKLTEITEKAVMIERNQHKNMPDPYKTWAPILPENVVNPMAKKIGTQLVSETINCDMVVLAMGSLSNDNLFYKLQEKRAAKEIYNLGDSYKSGRVFEAVRAAYRKAIII